MDTVYRRIIAWTLQGAAFLVPLFFLPWTTGILEFNKLLLVMIAAGICLICWLLETVSSGRLLWRSTPFDLPVLAIAVATAIATLFSIAPFQSIFGAPTSTAASLAAILSLTILYFAVVYTVRDHGRSLVNTFGVSFTIAFFFGLLQLLGIHILKFSFANSRTFTTVGSPNMFGSLAAIMIALLAHSSARGWVRIVHTIGAILALIILILLNWWILWAIAIAGMAGLIAFDSVRHERFRIGRFVIPMSVIVVAVFFLLTGITIPGVKSNLPVEVSPAFHLSAHIAKSVLVERFISGYGPENFTIAFDQYGAQSIGDSTLATARFSNSVSALFDAIVHGGLLMILALLFLIWTVGYSVMKFFRHRGSESEQTDTAAIWGTGAAIGVAFVLYTFSLATMFLAFLFLAFVGLTLVPAELSEMDIERNAILSASLSLGFIAGLIVILIGGYFGASAYAADVQYARAINSSDIQQTAQEVSDAVNWNGHDDTYYRAASQAALGLLQQTANTNAKTPTQQQTSQLQNYVTSAINLAKTATAINPHESLNWENLGSVYASLLGVVSGVDQLSAAAYAQASQLRPGDPTFANETGNLYVTEAQLVAQNGGSGASQQVTAALASAEKNYQDAVNLSPNYGLAIYNLGQVYDQEGKLTEAINQLEKIAPANPDQPNLLFELGFLYYRNGQSDKAMTTLQQVLVLQPDFANAHWYLSLLYQQKGDIPDAIDQLNQILAVDANKDNQTVLDQLHQLQSGKPATNAGTNQKPL